MHLRALDCIHFPSRCASWFWLANIHCNSCLEFAWQTVNSTTGCLGVYALVAKAENWRQGDTDFRKSSQDFCTVGRSFHQSSRQRAMCLFTSKECMALCRTWNGTNKRLADEVEFDGGKGKRTANYWRFLAMCIGEQCCNIHSCIGVLYGWYVLVKYWSVAAEYWRDIGGFFGIAYLQDWCGISIKGTQNKANHISGRCYPTCLQDCLAPQV